MARIKTNTIPEQAAIHLREGIANGRWVGEMPGRDQLVAELGVSPRSIQKAMKILEKEGLLVSQGQGRRTMIQLPEKGLEARPLRVALLLFELADRHDPMFLELHYQLDEAGHIPILCHEGSKDLGMNLKRLELLVGKTNADAWVVFSASEPVLKWFVDQNINVFAFAGRRFKLPIPGTGPNKIPLFGVLIQKLISLGHRRIVLIYSKNLRLPEPSKSARAFLNALNESGIVTGKYNLPDWEESAEGFRVLLDSLFQNTPPTTLILDEAYQFHTAYHYLAQRNLRVPQDVSLVCTDGDPTFKWCKPSVAHFHWDYQPVVRRIMRWVDNVARGVDDRRQGFTKAEYIDGGTVGPPPGRDKAQAARAWSPRHAISHL